MAWRRLAAKFGLVPPAQRVGQSGPATVKEPGMRTPGAPSLIGFRPIYAPAQGSVVTRAFISCGRCGASMSPHGGPIEDAVCIPCASWHINTHRRQCPP